MAAPDVLGEILRLPAEERARLVDYYESRHTGLGSELEDEIDTAFEMLVQAPEAGAPWKGRADRRVLVLERFPFTLPSRIDGDSVVILALAHTSRRPGYWKRRL